MYIMLYLGAILRVVYLRSFQRILTMAGLNHSLFGQNVLIRNLHMEEQPLYIKNVQKIRTFFLVKQMSGVICNMKEMHMCGLFP